MGIAGLRGRQQATESWQYLRGFSLIEAIVALALAGIVMTTVTAFVWRPAGIEAQTAATEIRTSLRRARMLALSTQRASDLTIDVEARTLRTEATPVARVLPQGVRLKVITADTLKQASIGRIRYFPDGSSSGGRVTVISAKETLHIDIDWLTGRAKTATDDGASRA